MNVQRKKKVKQKMGDEERLLINYEQQKNDTRIRIRLQTAPGPIPSPLGCPDPESRLE